MFVIKVSRFQMMLLLMLAIPSLSMAQAVAERDISGVAGLEIEPGAAHAGAAGAFGAVASDAFSLYYNPAGSVYAGRYAAGFMHNEWIADVRSEYVSFIWMPDRVALGASLLYNTVGDIERREGPSSEPLALFDSQDLVAALSAGFYIGPEFSVGLTGKVIYERIDVSSATAFAMDLGGYYKFLPNVDFGIAVSNLGTKMKFESQEDELPLVFRVGGSYNYRTLDVGMSLVTPMDDNPHLHVGAQNLISNILTLRAGYASGYSARDFTFGFGVKHEFASIDYAYMPIDLDLGDSHRLSLTLSWR
jgi:hypothetical protein